MYFSMMIHIPSIASNTCHSSFSIREDVEKYLYNISFIYIFHNLHLINFKCEIHWYYSCPLLAPWSNIQRELFKSPS